MSDDNMRYNADSVRTRLDQFRTNHNLVKSPTPDSNRWACNSFLLYSAENHNPILREKNFIRFLKNELNEYFFKLTEENRWYEISVLIDLVEQHRYRVVYLCTGLLELDRHDELYKIIELIANKQWNLIEELTNLAYGQRWDNISGLLYNIEHPPEPSLFQMQRENQLLNNLIKHTAPAGLTQDQAQNINSKWGESLIKINADYQESLNKATIEVTQKHDLNEENLRFAQKQQDQGLLVSLNDANSDPTTDKGTLDYKYIRKNFIQTYSICRENIPDENGEYPLHIWASEKHCFRTVEKLIELNSRFKKLAYDIYGEDISLSDEKVNDMIKSLRFTSAPTIEESGLLKASETQLFFSNGYYDFSDAQFHEIDTRRYFHTASLQFAYDPQAPNPKWYNEILNGMFNGNATEITLAKELTGAMCFQGAIKTIAVFQGESHGGKSTFAEIILRLLEGNTIITINGINDIKEGRFKSLEKKARLLYVPDAPNKPLESNTVSYLKICTSGISGKSSINFKVMICTNHSIYSERVGGIEDALAERIVVLPFRYNLKSISEDKSLDEVQKKYYDEIRHYFDRHFEDEKQGIIYEAIKAFQHVFDNGKNFIYRYPLNECVTSVRPAHSPDFFNSTASNYPVVSNTHIPQHSDKEIMLKDIVEAYFDFTEDENQYTLAEEVFTFINSMVPDMFGRTEEIGKILKKIFDKDLKWSKRRDNKTWYKIKLKNKTLDSARTHGE